MKKLNIFIVFNPLMQAEWCFNRENLDISFLSLLPKTNTLCSTVIFLHLTSICLPLCFLPFSFSKIVDIFLTIFVFGTGWMEWWAKIVIHWHSRRHWTWRNSPNGKLCCFYFVARWIQPGFLYSFNHLCNEILKKKERKKRK